MYFWELIVQFFHDMRRRKLRTALALFGIAWGTISVVLLLAVGNSFHAASSKAMHGMGDHIVIVWTAQTTKPYKGMQPGRAIEMKADEVIAMGRALPEIGLCAPELSHGGRTLSFGDHRVKAPVAGVVPEYEIMRNMIPVPGGRFINPLDIDHHRRVIFIGDELKNKLFGDDDGIGQTILVDGRPFVVIGALKKKIQSSNYSGPDSDRAFIPYTTFIAIWGNWNVSNILVTPEPKPASKPMVDAIYGYLAQKYRFDPSDKGALFTWDTVEMDQFFTWFFWGLKALFGLGGALTLGAGGIGVANIMFLIVRERTREIGVRMAVGARDGHILGQILLEAVLIVGIGGLGGFAFSALVIGGLNMFPLPDWLAPPELSLSVSALTVGILSLVGLAAGIFPARRAARLDPVRALEF